MKEIYKEKRKCHICNVEIDISSRSVRCCSKRCADKDYHIRNKNKKLEKDKQRKLIIMTNKYLNGRRCVSCHKDIPLLARKDKIFCSKKCNGKGIYTKEYRQLHKDRIKIANHKWYLNGGYKIVKRYNIKNRVKIRERQKTLKILNPEQDRRRRIRYYLNGGREKRNMAQKLRYGRNKYSLLYYHIHKKIASIRTRDRKKLVSRFKIKPSLTCQLCNSTDNIQIHHFRYDVQISPINQAIAYSFLCRDCHLAQHGRKSYNLLKTEMANG